MQARLRHVGARSLQAETLHGHIVGVCSLASEVDADSERFPENWMFHVR